MAEREEKLKSLLMKVQEESEKAGLKLSLQKAKIMASDPTTLWQIDGAKMETGQTSFSWPPKSLEIETAAMKLKDVCSFKENYDKPRQCIKKNKHCFANKCPYSQSYGISSSHVRDVRIGP